MMNATLTRTALGLLLLSSFVPMARGAGGGGDGGERPEFLRSYDRFPLEEEVASLGLLRAEVLAVPVAEGGLGRARAEATRVLLEVEAGGDFAALARDVTGAPLVGASLVVDGVPATGDYPEALIHAVAELGASGEVAGPVEAEGAIFLARLAERVAGEPPGLWEILSSRVKKEPFLVVASLIFLCAILHTFMANSLMKIAHRLEHEHQRKIREEGRTGESKPHEGAIDDVSFSAQFFHFLGEIEAVFGIWVVVLGTTMAIWFDWGTAATYIGEVVHYTEPIFVVVIMTIASTRPVLRLSEQCLAFVAKLGGGTPAAWWLSILTLAPILGSFITEPAAMTIGALLLAKKFYRLRPALKFAYATLGLLFVNVSVGGTLSHFAAPPVLMVVTPWEWDFGFMLTNYGWKAMVGIVVANALYFYVFRGEFARLQEPDEGPDGGATHWRDREDPIPVWVTAAHLGFLAWTVINLHHPALVIGGLLFFLAFAQATFHHQNEVSVKSPLLVGFFLAGLVIHGGCQGWWISPVLESLGEWPLMIGATILTAFNDNAAITFLASQVQGLGDSMKYAVVAGAVTGGGLTVIANAPNPAGQSILSRYFPDGINPLGLFLGALVPTIILGAAYMLLPSSKVSPGGGGGGGQDGHTPPAVVAPADPGG